MGDDGRECIVLLCAMDVAQGLPWGFMVTALLSDLAERRLKDADAG